MKLLTRMAVVFLSCGIPGGAALAQQGGPAGRPPGQQGPPTLTSTLQFQLSIVERETVSIAEAMPEDKYAFAPTNGNFAGVRTFAQEVKHIATANDRFSDSILGNTPPTAPDEGVGSNGPDAIVTKAQIVQYLKDSYAMGHKAFATITADNAFTPLQNPAVPFLNTRMALAMFACTHAMDHYGQMVEYLRDVGGTPPMSANRPPANPPATAPKQ
ncbi:MAG: DinB family protein [Candidatus Acidiferrales bacterium]